MKMRLGLMTFLLATSCSNHNEAPAQRGETGVAVAPQSIAGNTIDKAGPVSGVSGGANVTGVLIPTATGIVSRLENGLEKIVLASRGNFSRALAQVRTNLPKVTNVNDAAGYDQVQLLAYASCSDLTTGTTPLMQTAYRIQPTGTIASNQAALVTAGMRILDQHVAGLASQGPSAATLNQILVNLVQTQAADTNNTPKSAFMAVCIAAQTAGAVMLGQ